MKAEFIAAVNKLEEGRGLDKKEYKLLIESAGEETFDFIREKALKVREKIYGRGVYIRGLIEISNICKNNCLYCGIRKDNGLCQRYRLSDEEILLCCKEGYDLGFRTFVLQGGEDPFFTDDRLCGIIGQIKSRFPNCAVTLSLGERSAESYERLFKAGADRYLLRHETADKSHYEKLHPSDMSFENRIKCLYKLKSIGYQVGCGFMVGSPYQNGDTLAADLKFIETFEPDMCGIGPFIPHRDTPFGEMPAGSVFLTCYLLSIIRLIKPNILLPATTALSTLDKNGREKGILSGANVVMPNLSPESVRGKYELYNGKAHSGAESAQLVKELCRSMEKIGHRVLTERGDIKK